MKIFAENTGEFQRFTDCAEEIAALLAGYGREEDAEGVRRLITNFQMKTEDFCRENRKLNIGVVGQVKAGKSSFLNTLLFGGQEILPKAATPKTATLTKMEYSEENIIQVEYYSPEEWEILEDNAAVDLEDEIYTSAREITEMVRRNGVDPMSYLEKGQERIRFDTYDELLRSLNNYVGEDGKFTPLVKAVILHLKREEFKGLSIVDTPGLNDPIASRTIRTKEFMELCDVVFFLSQSGSFLDKSDWTLLSSQLPQKGVKKLMLIASKYDSGVRDVLRVQDEDDIFGEDGNTADNIPGACRIIRKKLTKRARSKVEEFVKDLEARESSPELIRVIRQCAEPCLVSSLAYNMTGKEPGSYTPEEKNICEALKPFSRDMEEDLRLLGNFDLVKELFEQAAQEKEEIFAAKAESFVPNALEELRDLLRGYLEKTRRRVQLLEGSDREKLLEQKKAVEEQINGIRADIAVLFGELNAGLETERASAVREIRGAAGDYLSIRDRTGTKVVHDTRTVSDARWYNPFSWGRKHLEHYSYEEHYSYCIAADAIENLKKYALEATGQVEEVFSQALQLKAIKRRLLNIVAGRFDLGSENYDSSLFRILVEETVNRIQFPEFHVDITQAMTSIAGAFNGELTSAGEKTELAAALSNAISRIYEELCAALETRVISFREELGNIGKKTQESLLENITVEFETLLCQCRDRDREIAGHREYAAALEKALAGVGQEE